MGGGVIHTPYFSVVGRALVPDMKVSAINGRPTGLYFLHPKFYFGCIMLAGMTSDVGWVSAQANLLFLYQNDGGGVRQRPSSL